jgi:hypothetical protein
VLAISLIVSTPPFTVVLKIGSLPLVTVNGVAVPEHAGAIPEKAMQGVLLDTDNCAVPLLLTNTPVSVIGIGVANADPEISIKAPATVATLNACGEFLNLLIFLFYLPPSLSIRD